MSEITEPILLDSTGQTLIQKLHNQNLLLQAIAGTGIIEEFDNFAEVSAVVKSNDASRIFPVGYQFNVKYKATSGTEYDMPWRVVGFDPVTLADGSVVPALWLQSVYATLEGVQFDVPEPGNTLGSGGAKDSNVASYGYNRWSESGIRAWLNSDAATNGWWGSQFERGGEMITRREADVAPTQLSSIQGFMKGLPKDFTDVLGKIKVQTSCNTVTDGGVTDVTYDKIFLPSLEQMYGTPQASGIEGNAWDYWKQALGISSPASYHPSTYEAYKTYALENHSSAQYCRLRSAHRGYSYNTWYVSPTGYLNAYGAYDSFRCAPACVVI